MHIAEGAYGSDQEYIFREIILCEMVEMRPRKVLATLASIGQARIMQIAVLNQKERKEKLIMIEADTWEKYAFAVNYHFKNR